MGDAATSDAMASYAGLARLLAAGERNALVVAAHHAGLLDACAAPARPEEVAAAVGRPLPLVRSTCDALVAFGVLERDGDRVTVAPTMSALTDPVLRPLVDRLVAFNRVTMEMVAALFDEGGDYWAAAGADRLAVADAVSPPAGTELARRLLTGRLEEVPDARDLLAAGGHYLELGCGTAGGLLTLLTIFPEMRAVGVDLSADLLEVAEARAERLGVADRVRFVAQDATTYVPDEPVDVVFWSQFFFPEPARAGALARAFAALRPGGHLVAPVMYADADLDAAPGTDEAIDVALRRLVFGSWGVPVRSAGELAEEVRAAGFTGVQVRASAASPMVAARRP